MINKKLIGYLIVSCLMIAGNYCSSMEIISVKFGVGKHWADITEQFKKMIINDDLYLGYIDGNRMAGRDPASRIAKKAIVKYKDDDGIVKKIDIKEKTFGGVSSGVELSRDFKLGKAWFGGDKSYVDITDRMREIMKSGKEVTLNQSTLKIAKDPLYGKQKKICIFYSIDNQPKLIILKEKSKFKASMIDFSLDPIPLAEQVSSPFKGIELDKAVWQWSTIVKGSRSKENGKPVRAFLWIPDNCKKLRGVVIGQFNMLERPLMEYDEFRKTLKKIGFGCIWIAPSPYGWCFKYKDPEQGKLIYKMLASLADISGYSELKDVPRVGIGHSAMANFPWQLAALEPKKALAGVSISGTWPDADKNMNIKELLELKGMPMLVRIGEYEWAMNRAKKGLGLRNKYPELPITMIADSGAWHFDIHSDLVKEIAFFIEKADKYRNSSDGKLRDVKSSDGWLYDRWRNNKDAKAEPAPVAEYKGNKKEAFWTFDEESAKRLEKYNTRFKGKKVQLLGYEHAGKIFPQNKRAHQQVTVYFKPGKDGLSMKLKGVFLDTVPEGGPEKWVGKKAGSEIAHSNDPERIKLKPICGPVVTLNNNTAVLRFYRTGFDNPRRRNEIWMMLEYPGNDEYRRVVQQSCMRVRYPLTKGIKQRITFPKIADQKEGTKSVELKAFVNTGLPVEYFVKEGPAYIKDNKLIFTKVPPRAKFPVKVTVTAWQYGSPDKPKVQTAPPVENSFYIKK